MKITSLFLLISSSLILIGCTQQSPVSDTPTGSETDGKALQIVTTFPPLYAHVANLVDENDTVTNLVPPGTSVHTWQPRPSDVKAMETADAIITNGLGLEEFLEGYLNTLEKNGVQIIDTSEGVDTISYEEEDEHDDDEHDDDEHDDDEHDDDEHDDDEHDDDEHDDDEHDDDEHDDHAHNHGGTDPHIWLDPRNAVVQVGNIAEALISLDASQEDVYKNQAKSYQQELEVLDSSIKESVDNSTPASFIVFHDAYQYFLQRYELEQKQVGLVQEFHGDNPSQKQIASLIQTIEQNAVKTIYTEPQFNPSVVTRLEQETGVTSKEIDPIGSELNKAGYITTLTTLAEGFTNP